jgi:hypothetical protein
VPKFPGLCDVAPDYYLAKYRGVRPNLQNAAFNIIVLDSPDFLPLITFETILHSAQQVTLINTTCKGILRIPENTNITLTRKRGSQVAHHMMSEVVLNIIGVGRAIGRAGFFNIVKNLLLMSPLVLPRLLPNAVQSSLVRQNIYLRWNVAYDMLTCILTGK